MFRISTYSQLLKSIVFTMLVAGLTAAQAPAGPRRPAAVPADYLITPFGYFHSSCVKHLAKGDVLREDKNAVQHANGASENVQQCAYPHFRADGEVVTGNEPAGAQPPDITHAWIEYASIHDSPNYAEVYAQWDVPPSPTSDDGQTLYFFNGLERWTNDLTIIQPVLGWNSDYSNAWGIAAWNCCYSGDTWEATPEHANPGDSLEGYVETTCSPGTKNCSQWDIVIIDDDNGNFSQFIDVPNHGQSFDWAFGGVLEVYNILQCSDYPGNRESSLGGALGFYNQIVVNYEYVKITPGWTVSNVSGGLTPQCNYGGSLPKQVILTY